jgi:hypothetical protein
MVGAVLYEDLVKMMTPQEVENMSVVKIAGPWP